MSSARLYSLRASKDMRHWSTPPLFGKEIGIILLARNMTFGYITTIDGLITIRRVKMLSYSCRKCILRILPNFASLSGF